MQQNKLFRSVTGEQKRFTTEITSIREDEQHYSEGYEQKGSLSPVYFWAAALDLPLYY